MKDMKEVYLWHVIKSHANKPFYHTFYLIKKGKEVEITKTITKKLQYSVGFAMESTIKDALFAESMMEELDTIILSKRMNILMKKIKENDQIKLNRASK